MGVVEYQGLKRLYMFELGNLVEKGLGADASTHRLRSHIDDAFIHDLGLVTLCHFAQAKQLFSQEISDCS